MRSSSTKHHGDSSYPLEKTVIRAKAEWMALSIVEVNESPSSFSSESRKCMYSKLRKGIVKLKCYSLFDIKSSVVDKNIKHSGTFNNFPAYAARFNSRENIMFIISSVRC
ncbi:hypothetical protein SUGI_0675970 [Cryptomeria japonica]|nr:hypothetical protein SUGI_0675970 [Cryptomeria japonica]